MMPKRPWVINMAELSTRVMAAIASWRWRGGQSSVITPLAAGADPEAKGSKKAATLVS